MKLQKQILHRKGSIDVGFTSVGQGILCGISPFINGFISHQLSFYVLNTKIK